MYYNTSENGHHKVKRKKSENEIVAQQWEKTSIDAQPFDVVILLKN